MKIGNVQSVSKGPAHQASLDQFDELRICVEKSFNKLRRSMDRDVAQGWIGNSAALDRHMRRLLPDSEVEVARSTPEAVKLTVSNWTEDLPKVIEFFKRNPGKIMETVWEIQDAYNPNDRRMPVYQLARLLGLALGFTIDDMASTDKVK